jgi:hypothetical protein
MLAMLGILLAVAPRVVAQSEPSPDRSKIGVGDSDAIFSKLVADAVTAFDAGRFRESRELLTRAHQLRPNARTLRGMGLAAFEEGRYSLAVLALDGALNETRQPMNAEQRAECEQLRAESDALTARYAVIGLPEGAELRIDGEEAVWDSAGYLLVDQGTHTLTLRHAGELRNWKLAARGGQRSEFALRSQGQNEPEAVEAPPPIAAQAELEPARLRERPATGIPNTVAYVALATAAVTGGLAIWQWSERESEVDAWNSDDCLRSRRTRRANCGAHEDAYQRAEVWGWVAAGATVALSAGAVTLLLLNGASEEQQPRAALPVCLPGPVGFACRVAF